MKVKDMQGILVDVEQVRVEVGRDFDHVPDYFVKGISYTLVGSERVHYLLYTKDVDKALDYSARLNEAIELGLQLEAVEENQEPEEVLFT